LPGASILAHETTEMLAFVCEGFCFVYFGLSSVKYWTQDTFSMGRNMTYTLGLLFVRTFVASCLSLVLKWISPGPHRLSARELMVVGLGGAMRGILAYALVQQAVPQSTNNQSIEDEKMLMCVLFVVLTHTCFGGLVFPLALRKLPPEVEVRAVQVQGQPLGAAGDAPTPAPLDELEEATEPPRAPEWFITFKDRWHAFDETFLQPYVGLPNPERYGDVIARVRAQSSSLLPPVVGSGTSQPFLGGPPSPENPRRGQA